MTGAHLQCPVCGAGRVRHMGIASSSKELWSCQACDATWDEEERIAPPGDPHLSTWLAMEGVRREDLVFLDEATDPAIVGPTEPTPPVQAVRAAEADLGHILTSTGLVVAGCPVLLLVGYPFIDLVPFLTMLAWGFGLTFGAIYGIAWRRARVARRLIRTSTPRAVWAIGWERAPDGDNYALFLHGSTDDPDFVVRLPLRRELLERSTPAWVYGPLRPNLLGGVALVGPNGLLATGRIVGKRSARARWRRRGTEPNLWVQRPPEDWLPPGGQ